MDCGLPPFPTQPQRPAESLRDPRGFEELTVRRANPTGCWYPSNRWKRRPRLQPLSSHFGGCGGASASGEERQHRLGHAGSRHKAPSASCLSARFAALAPYSPMASEEEQQLPEQFSADPALAAFTALFQPSSSPISSSSCRFPQPGWLRLSRPED